jgi:hypothetical protein
MMETARIQFENLKLLIIDEISMCSNALLTKIHLRLQQITGRHNTPFGGCNILAAGDLMQLPPVKQPFVFEDLDDYTLRVLFDSVLKIKNLWSENFIYRELTTNVRQNADDRYAEILRRMRFSILTDIDLKILNQRRILKSDIRFFL